VSLTLTFHGAAECVTGSCMRLDTDHGRFLVDCGMFQGPKTLKTLNYEAFPFDPASIDGVFLTHAHIDHSGLLPKLVRAGYRGPIYATRATRDLCEVMLADSAEIQEGEVEHLNRRKLRRGEKPVEPIYSTVDVDPALRLFQTAKFGICSARRRSNWRSRQAGRPSACCSQATWARGASPSCPHPTAPATWTM
jgi:metallo-beta-lactamase family protein